MVEQISEIEIAKLYGKDNVEIANFFAIDGSIKSPFLYKAFAEIVSWKAMNKLDEQGYREILKTYDSDRKKRFEKSNQAIKDISMMVAAGFLDAMALNLDIRNIYDDHFGMIGGRKFFKSEIDLERIVYDSLYWFDHNDTVKIKRQFKTPAGAVDLRIEHEDNVYLVELKKKEAKRKDLYQVLDYKNSVDFKSQAVLVAFDFDKSVIELARELGIKCYRYDIALDLPDTIVILEPVVESSEFDNMLRYIVVETSDICSRLPKIPLLFSDLYKEVVERTNKQVNHFISRFNEVKQKIQSA